MELQTAGSNDSVPAGHFEIWPHRSLNRAGIGLLLAGAAAALGLVALRTPAPIFWPIAFGCIVTLGALSLALAFNMRSARLVERIEIGPRTVHVRRTGPAARSASAVFTTHWVRVVLSQDRKIANRITLVESGRWFAVGDFLSPQERAVLAQEIRKGIAAARSCNPSA